MSHQTDEEEFLATTGLIPPHVKLPDGTYGDPRSITQRQREWDTFLARKSNTPFQLVTDCRYGRFLVPVADEYVGQALLHYGEYSQIELELLLQFVTPQTRVIVAGANIGALVVPLAQKAGEVVAFEPQRWVFQLLCANAALNNLVNVRAYWAGLSDKRGMTRIPVLAPTVPNNFGALDIPAVVAQNIGGDAVPMMTLDSIPDADVGLLTIDVEGMELNVLQGGEKLIDRCRPVIFFEADREMRNKDVFNWLREHNYQLHWYRTPLYNPDNWRKNTTPGFVSMHNQVPAALNVLATPRERDMTLTGFEPVLA
jgi:FkbM family methyltransferase